MCKQDKDKSYESCLEEIKDSNDKGRKVVAKTEEFGEEPCDKCIVFVKLQADEQAEVIIHVQSQYSMI